MHAGENPQANGCVAAPGTHKQIARQRIGFTGRVETGILVYHEIRGMGGQLVQRVQQVSQGTPVRCGGTVESRPG